MASMEKVLLQPRMKWADMKSEVNITIEVSDVDEKHCHIDISDSKFKLIIEKLDNIYQVSFHLFKPIDKFSVIITGHEINVTLTKTVVQPWTQLTEDGDKLKLARTLSVDSSRMEYQDEDDDDNEEKKKGSKKSLKELRQELAQKSKEYGVDLTSRDSIVADYQRRLKAMKPSTSSTSSSSSSSSSIPSLEEKKK